MFSLVVDAKNIFHQIDFEKYPSNMVNITVFLLTNNILNVVIQNL